MAAGGRAYFPYISIYKTLKIFFSETNGPISIQLGRNVSLVTLYKDCSSRHDSSKNMATRGRGLFSLYIYIENFKNLLVGWSGGAKVLCILHHWGVQLILAYSWARPAILVVGKGRGGMFLFLLFLHFHSCSSFFPVPLFHLLYSLFYLFSPFLWETTQNDPQGLTCR